MRLRILRPEARAAAIAVILAAALLCGPLQITYAAEAAGPMADETAGGPAADATSDAQAIPRFSDVPETNWAYGVVGKGAAAGIVEGYPDGTFRPTRDVTYGEFIKMAAAAAGLEAISAQADPTSAGTPSGADAASASADEPAKRHWAAPYYDAAVGAGWFGAHQIDELQLPLAIPRSDMALIAVGAIQAEKMANGGTKDQTSDGAIGVISGSAYDAIQALIKDVDASVKNEYEITVAYGLGILNGYPDGSFGPGLTLTRAEATAVAMRISDPAERVVSDAVVSILEGAQNGAAGGAVGTAGSTDGSGSAAYIASDGAITDIVSNSDSVYYSGDGSLNEYLAAAKGYVDAKDPSRYGIYVFTRNGFAGFGIKNPAGLGSVYTVVDGEIKELLPLLPADDGSINCKCPDYIGQVEFFLSQGYDDRTGAPDIVLLRIRNPLYTGK